MRTTIGIKGVARSVLVALALMIAAGACGKLSGPAPDQDGGQPKKSKFKITGVVSLITDWVVPSVHAAEAIAWKEPTASVAKSQTEPGPCPNEFEPVNDGLYAYLYRITEDTLDIEALDPATLKPLCVTRVDEKSGTYTFDFTDEDPELNAAYIVAKRFAAAEGETSGSASNLTLKSPFYLFSGLPTGDTNYLAPVARPPGEQLMVAKKMLVVGSEAPQALVEAAPEAPNSALSAKDFLREAFFSKTTDVIAGESDLKLDIDPVSSVGLGTKAVAYRMGGISKALANGLNTTPAELLTSLLNDTSVAEAVTTAIGNGEFTLADLVSGDPKAIIGKISVAPSLKTAIASFRQNALSDPVSTAVKIVKARGAENTEKLLLQYATDLEGSVARAGFEAPGRVALAVEVLNKVHALAMKNDFPNVAMKTEATLVVAADQITARLKKYEDEAIAKLKEEEENIVQGEGFELVEAKPMDPAKIFAAMGTTRQAAFRRFNTVFQNNLNPEFLNFQSNESAESLLIASKTISPMFETATLFINEQEAA
ncbi:MAG: hypothetical protein HYW49_12105, partial [Deltaproteobacteria bacterium]|nr:hypothetical protein [Deltaproteobacteria bacterium]